MTSATSSRSRPAILSLPNQLTVLRLVLSVVLFVLIAFKCYLSSLILFVVAASTDWLDGYLARRYSLVTTLGRMLDPFADKVIMCGTFIFLGAIPGSGLTPAMAVVIVARELLVTAIRSFLEQQGADFSANLAGKLKMVLQCAAVAMSLAALALVPHSTTAPRVVALVGWLAVASTIYSGAIYMHRAAGLMKDS